VENISRMHLLSLDSQMRGRAGWVHRTPLLGLVMMTSLTLCLSPDPDQAIWPVRPFVAQGPAVFHARIAANPQEESNYLKGSQACEMQGDFQGAIEFLEEGVSAVPGVSAQFHFYLGQLYSRVGNHSAARQSLYEGLKRDPAQPKYLEMLALLEEESGELSIAERLYNAAYLQTSESNQRSFRMNRISYLLRASRFEDASRLFRPAALPGSMYDRVNGRLGDENCEQTQGLDFGTMDDRPGGWSFGGEFGHLSCLHAYMSRWQRTLTNIDGSGNKHAHDSHRNTSAIYRGAAASCKDGSSKSSASSVPGQAPGLLEASEGASAVQRKQTAVKLLRQQIASLQAPDDCSRARAVIMRLEHDDMGFSASFHMVVLALNYALLTNRTLVRRRERARERARGGRGRERGS
jgi:tetratricopeptide (TPR) repeat protein